MSFDIDSDASLLLIMAIVQDGRMHNSAKGFQMPGRVAKSVGHLTRKSGILGSIPGLATYLRFSFR